MPEEATAPQTAAVERQRWKLLVQFHDLLEKPLIALGACWLALVIVDLAYGLTPGLSIANWTIWGIFVADAAIEFFIAPKKLGYIRRHWLTLLAVALPAVRIVRIVPTLRFARSVRLIRLLSSLNRNLRLWRTYMVSGRIAVVIAVTTAVVFAGAAGMYSFEKPQALYQAGISNASGLGKGPGLTSYPEALWWTAMLVTTMGTDYWPKTPEGRVLCLLLSIYALSVFGYITASLASFFIGKNQRA